MDSKKTCEDMPKMPDTREGGRGRGRRSHAGYLINITLVVYSHTMLNMLPHNHAVIIAMLNVPLLDCTVIIRSPNEANRHDPAKPS